MEYGPYFLNESGYVLQIITEPRQLWNMTENYSQNNDFYTINIFTNGFQPLTKLQLNYKTLEELFYKFTSIMSGKNYGYAFSLPRVSLEESKSVVIYREENSVAISIISKDVVNRESLVHIVLTPMDMAEFTNALMKVYIEGSGVYNELKE